MKSIFPLFPFRRPGKLNSGRVSDKPAVHLANRFIKSEIVKLWFQGKQVGKPRVRQYALLGNAWLEKESAILCPGSSPTSPDVMAQAVSSSLRGMSPYLRTIPGFCDEPNPVLRNVINSCQVQRVPPVLKLPGSLSFSFFSCEQPGGHSCVSLMLLSPKTSPGPHRVDAPSKICQ